jgi:hypothetical protein
MRTAFVRSAIAFAVLAAAHIAVRAQAPDMSGTWQMDQQRSRIAAGATYAGLIASGAPERLHVTQPANGTLIVESEINEGHVRMYTPRSKSTSPVFFQGGSITMTSKWEGRRLVSEGSQETPSGATTVVKQVKEVIALAADGALTIEITTSEPGGAPVATSLTYTRTRDVGPCETWTTPCKRK